jgi:Nucleotidyl transferase AbiEii toxin, Type IV TA system
LDFSLLDKNENFNIEDYFQHITNEFAALGININLNKKNKKAQPSTIESAFLKNDTSIHTLDINAGDLKNILGGIHSGKRIKIKIEVDIDPPLKFQTESKTLLMPVTFNIVSMTLPNLYAGKMHAVLCRNWKTRVKGRDWFDIEWYVKRNTKLNLVHLQERMVESGNLERNIELDDKRFHELMNERIDNLNIEKAIEEVKPFIKDHTVFEYWTKDYFRFLSEKTLLID